VPTLNVSVKLSASVTVDISALVLNTYIDQPYDRVNDLFLTGTASVTFADYTGDWNPQSITSPYAGLLVPLVPFTITADYASVNYSMFKGYVNSWTYRPANGIEAASVTVNLMDGLSILNNINITTLTYYGGDSIRTGYRIYGILLETGWDMTQTIINYGSTLYGCQADPGTSRTALNAIKTIENTEVGAFYADSNGYLVNLDRVAIATLSSATPYLFNDDGTNISYQDVSYVYDTDFISNTIQIVPPGFSPTTYQDPDSVNKYFERWLYRNDLLNNNGVDVANQALYFLAGRKDPILRMKSVTLDITEGQPSNRIIAGLVMDRYITLQVTRNAPGTTSLTKDLICCGLTYTITPDKWMVKIQTMEPEIATFVLDGTYPLAGGILDTNQLSY
jgi:hypothetical protein